MSIKSIVIEKELINNIDFVFENKFIDKCLKNNMWIAGGFARKIGHIVLGLSKPLATNMFILNYLSPEYTWLEKRKYKKPGDIDLFCNDIQDINKVINTINPHTINSHNQISYNVNNSNYAIYKSEFAENVSYNFKNNKLIKIQLVSKFIFNSIKDCFNSFDITNSKYAISKKNKNYILHYDDEAFKYDALGKLHISHSETPYLASRIVKYIRHRNIKDISNDHITVGNFKEYLYRCITDNWDNIYNIDNSFVYNSIKQIDQFKKLNNVELSMFIGKISHVISKSVECVGDYGIYMTTSYEDCDWATHKLLERV